jgi:hypothetical protein
MKDLGQIEIINVYVKKDLRIQDVLNVHLMKVAQED